MAENFIDSVLDWQLNFDCVLDGSLVFFVSFLGEKRLQKEKQQNFQALRTFHFSFSLSFVSALSDCHVSLCSLEVLARFIT